MKKPLLLFSFVGFLACLCFYLKAPESDPLYVSKQNQILPTPTEKPEPAVISLIREINQTNDGISSMSCENLQIELSRRMTVTVTGTVALEKNKRFRMVLSSKLGKELDIGSNDTHFWFWGKRMDPPALHYARYEDLPKARMKPALNPAWMMESMNIGRIDHENISATIFKQYYAVIQSRTAPTGEKVTAVTLIDPTRKLVIGRYLYNSSDRMMASSEVKSFQTIDGQTIPKEIVIIWYEEGLRMELTLNGVKINVGIDPKQWSMPTYPQTIDMGK